jgi:ribonuclease VapC
MIGILAEEEDHLLISEKLASASRVLISPLAYYEACVGLARSAEINPTDAETIVRKLLKVSRAETIELSAEIGFEAMNAHSRFGKGRHRASLNMGDCFAYACAKVSRVPLLCKGNDFIHTDIVLA